MEKFKEDFINFLIENKGIRFGKYELKCKRISPYFFNIGDFYSGDVIKKLGYFYALKIISLFGKNSIDVIFGPSYKGIPLAISTIFSLGNDFNCIKEYSFNRKIEKDHGEGGIFIGSPLKNKNVLIVDDVFTTGKTKYEIINQIANVENTRVAGILIALNRCETNGNGKTSVKEFTLETGIPVYEIISVFDLMDFLENNSSSFMKDENMLNEMKEYTKKYCYKE